MMSTDATLEDVPAEMWIADGRVSISADGDTRVALQTPDQQPLSIREPEFTLQITGDEFEAMISLDTKQADIVRSVLEDGEDE